eukprot:376801_1
MGSEQSRYKRRHTVAVNPSKQQTQTVESPKKQSNGHNHPNKMVRSISTPTIDYKSSTPNQHLITSNTPKIKKKRSHTKNASFFPFKHKQKHKFKNNEESIPYIHFNDESGNININEDNHMHREKHVEKEKEKDDDNNKKKILLLGNGSCGKTTIFKQLKLILGKTHSFDENELTEATHAIRQNCVSVLLLILHKSTMLYYLNNEYFNECFIDDKNKKINDSINYLMKFRSESFESIDSSDLQKLSVSISYLWNLKSVQTAIKYRYKRFAIPDNISYFYDKIEIIFDEEYVPSIADIIRLRIRTTGMIESKYTIHSGINLSIFDTGGERNERKKWIHTFSDVDIVIFVAALSHYSCVLWEDEKTISMHDAIELFNEICNGRWFRRSKMILILNKKDIFRKLLYNEIALDIAFTDDIKNKDYNDNHNKFIAFENLNAWNGLKYNGPKYKYDTEKTDEEKK